MNYIIFGIVGILALWIALTYNKFIRLRNRAEEAWADIDVQLKRRYDLIPNLVNSVKGYATHESEAFEKVTRARAEAMGTSTNPAEKSEKELELSGTLKSLFAIAEAYPDLKANQNFIELQKELSDTENKIQAARRFYNTNVMELNTGIESFPGNLIAGPFNFGKKDFFELEEDEAAAREPVQVKF